MSAGAGVTFTTPPEMMTVGATVTALADATSGAIAMLPATTAGACVALLALAATGVCVIVPSTTDSAIVTTDALAAFGAIVTPIKTTVGAAVTLAHAAIAGAMAIDDCTTAGATVATTQVAALGAAVTDDCTALGATVTAFADTAAGWIVTPPNCTAGAMVTSAQAVGAGAIVILLSTASGATLTAAHVAGDGVTVTSLAPGLSATMAASQNSLVLIVQFNDCVPIVPGSVYCALPACEVELFSCSAMSKPASVIVFVAPACVTMPTITSPASVVVALVETVGEALVPVAVFALSLAVAAATPLNSAMMIDASALPVKLTVAVSAPPLALYAARILTNGLTPPLSPVTSDV